MTSRFMNNVLDEDAERDREPDAEDDEEEDFEEENSDKTSAAQLKTKKDLGVMLHGETSPSCA